MDHPIMFASWRLSKVENNYPTTEREGLAMVYVLQKYRDYLLGGICRWLLLFQEYDFEVIVKLGRLNAGPYHFSRIETGEKPTNLEEGLPDA